MKTLKTKSIVMVISCIIFLLLPQNTKAQELGFQYGYRFGIGESRLKFSETNAGSGKLFLTAGATGTYQFNRLLGVGVDFMFTSKGGKLHSSTTTQGPLYSTERYYDDTYQLYYCEIPLSGKISIPIGKTFSTYFIAGPSINFKLLALQSRQYQDANYNEDYGYEYQDIGGLETVEYALFYGLGVEVLGKNQHTFFLDIRKNDSQNSLGSINNSQVKSQYFAISTGYKF